MLKHIARSIEIRNNSNKTYRPSNKKAINVPPNIKAITYECFDSPALRAASLKRLVLMLRPFISISIEVHLFCIVNTPEFFFPFFSLFNFIFAFAVIPSVCVSTLLSRKFPTIGWFLILHRCGG